MQFIHLIHTGTVTVYNLTRLIAYENLIPYSHGARPFAEYPIFNLDSSTNKFHFDAKLVLLFCFLSECPISCDFDNICSMHERNAMREQHS